VEIDSEIGRVKLGSRGAEGRGKLEKKQTRLSGKGGGEGRAGRIPEGTFSALAACGRRGGGWWGGGGVGSQQVVEGEDLWKRPLSKTKVERRQLISSAKESSLLVSGQLGENIGGGQKQCNREEKEGTPTQTTVSF